MQAHFATQGPTNQRPGTLQIPHIGLAGSDESTPGHLTDPSHATAGSCSTLLLITLHLTGPAGVDKSTSGPLLLGHCKLTLPRKGRQINAQAPYRSFTGLARDDKSTLGHLPDPSQAVQGPTDQRLGTLQTLHRPRKGRQIHAWTPPRSLTGRARADKSVPVHLTDLYRP